MTIVVTSLSVKFTEGEGAGVEADCGVGDGAVDEAAEI
jgi:hypothetical protein